ncbi:hypothetical protein EYF80_037613 [Liparis tanakae]|uniref:Secreted protein n=1 Tax=Liparis tanakae TaxID=230148 RepID=A0A4Z2GH29_9TELE|nr:hypothetical protein EYF80_037613 [Liparis tanakae]
MTSLTYSAYMFVFVFLNAMDLSKEGCYEYLDVDKWDRVNCTLETECQGGREAACNLLIHCFLRNDVTTKSPECEASSEGIPFYHFMCLIVNDIMPSSKGTLHTDAPLTISGGWFTCPPSPPPQKKVFLTQICAT